LAAYAIGDLCAGIVFFLETQQGRILRMRPAGYWFRLLALVRRCSERKTCPRGRWCRRGSRRRRCLGQQC